MNYIIVILSLQLLAYFSEKQIITYLKTILCLNREKLEKYKVRFIMFCNPNIYGNIIFIEKSICF